MDWEFTEAQRDLPALVSRALLEGPQRIHRDTETVVVISEAKYAELLRSKKERDFKAFLMSGPSFEGVDLTRSKSLSRETEFDDDPTL